MPRFVLRSGLAAASLLLWLANLQSLAAAFQRDFIDAGFQLNQLVAISGSGADPGRANPQARLEWAVATAIPVQWRQAVPVVWSIGEVTSGTLALSYHDGTTVVSPRVVGRSAEDLLATVAHEMGHQIAIALVPAGDGSPPRGFVEALPGHPYNRFDEGWADCVSRVWTGSLHHTRDEPAPCSVEAARYVAALLADPENVRREGLPLPSPTISPSPSPAPEQPVSAFPSPRPEPSLTPERRSAGGVPSLLVIAAILLLLGPPLLVRLVRALVPDEPESRR